MISIDFNIFICLNEKEDNEFDKYWSTN